MDNRGLNFVPLAKGEFEDRYSFLVDHLGLTSVSIDTLRQNSPALCDIVKAQRRFDHLMKLGFHHPSRILNDNPLLLLRSRKNVAAKFHLWKKEARNFDPKMDFYNFCRKYPQIFSASIEKVRIVFALARHISHGVNVERLCNVITLNLEAVLIAYVTYQCENLIVLHTKARHIANANKRKSIEAKRSYIIQHSEKLPCDVFQLYEKMISR